LFTHAIQPGGDSLGDHLTGLAAHALADGPLGTTTTTAKGRLVRGDGGAVDGDGGDGGGGGEALRAAAGRGGLSRRQQLRAHARLPPCSCVVLSGVPAREQLFNGSLCDAGGSFKDLLDRPDHIGAERRREHGTGRDGDRERNSARKVSGATGHKRPVFAAAPVVVPRLGATVGARHAAARAARAASSGSSPSHASAAAASAQHLADGRPMQFDAVFAVSSGAVTSYAPDGRLNWQTAGGPTWSEGSGGWLLRLPAPRGLASAAQQAYHLGAGLSQRRVGSGGAGAEELSLELLVVGEAELAVLSAVDGTVLATAPVPQPPRRRPILGDFDADGAAEVLLVTDGAVWGYTVAFSPGAGGGGGTLVVGLLVVLMVAVYFSHLEVDYGATSLHKQQQQQQQQQQRRSTSANGNDDGIAGDKGGGARRPTARLPRSTD
jgi:hypothetical protein